MLRRSTLFLVLTIALSLFAADPQRFGPPIPADATKVTLAQLVASPDKYNGKDVLLVGQYAGACGDGDMFYSEKEEVIEADPPSQDVFSLKSGTKVRLFGTVRARSGHVKVAAKTVEVEP